MIDFNVKKQMKETLRKVFRFVFGQKVYRDRVTRPYVVSLQTQGRFADRVAVITGGAGAIGRATACRLALEGAAVVVCGRHADTLQMVVDEMVQNGGHASFFICDIMNEAEVEALVDYTVKTYGRLDFFCNVAGGGARSEAQEIDKQKQSVFDAIINTNLTATLVCCKHAARQMKKQGGGKIINTGSTVGVRGLARYTEYATAKAAVMALTESLAMELGEHGITVNCVTPGIVQRGYIGDDDRQRIEKTNWLHRCCTPENIASMTAFLLSDEANFITGQNFIVDGGRSLGMKGC